jgi:molybdopterin-guanine dinucleotide biosynthesis protein A
MMKRADSAIEPRILDDLRRTATTEMAALNIPPDVVDRILNHTSGTIRSVAAVYNRHQYEDQRRDALKAWGRSVRRIVSDAPVQTVKVPTLKKRPDERTRGCNIGS